MLLLSLRFLVHCTQNTLVNVPAAANSSNNSNYGTCNFAVTLAIKNLGAPVIPINSFSNDLAKGTKAN